MEIPFLDLHKQYDSIKTEIDNAICNVINDSAFIRGKYVNEFEKNYANKYDVSNCISVGNGTDAIYIVLKMLGITNDDEVLVPALTWIATSETISQVGAKPVFVDIDKYYGIDAEKIEEKITPRTKAIIVVHLYGQPVGMDKIKLICDKNGIYLIEDCSQAHFAEYNGKNVGLFGVAGTFSFYPGKNLGAYGDAGAIITNDNDLAIKFRMFANHGAIDKHDHIIEGINSRLDGIQASILSVKLKYIDNWTKRRIEVANSYIERLCKINTERIILPPQRPNVKHVYHQFVLRCDKRDILKAFLSKNGIETGIHYPKSLPFLKAYEHLNLTKSDLPNSFNYTLEFLSLPIFPELTNDEINYVCDKIIEFYQKD